MAPILRRKVWKYLCSEKGSISVLTIGLFSVLLTTVLILSNISAVYLAKRTLIIATEAAVQRGSKNLDQSAYYSGEYNITSFLQGLLGRGEEDPGIPIDCEAGLRDAQEVILNWEVQDRTITRPGISAMQVSNFQCDGFQIYLESSAVVQLPFPLSFIGMTEIEINGSAGGIGERSETNNYYGIDLG
jgi:hypothetical protein